MDFVGNKLSFYIFNLSTSFFLPYSLNGDQPVVRVNGCGNRSTQVKQFYPKSPVPYLHDSQLRCGMHSGEVI